jgi:hypothetical protein
LCLEYQISLVLTDRQHNATPATHFDNNALGQRRRCPRLQPGHSPNGSDFTSWLTDTTDLSATFLDPDQGSDYFSVQAVDNVDNLSGWQTSTEVISSTVTKYYSHGSDRVAMRQGNEIYYLNGDHLGSTSLTTDSTGQVTHQARYLPYGESLP